MEKYYFVNWIIEVLIGAMLSLRSMKGGINRHFNKPLWCFVAITVIWASVFGNVTYAGLIPSPVNMKISTSGLSGPCICPPHLLARNPSSEKRSLAERQESMISKTQPGTNQASNDNRLELKILDIDSISIPKHHPRLDYGDLEKLQGSMKKDGIIEPLTVYEIEREDSEDSGESEEFGVIDGARKWKAAKEMGLKEVPCLIMRGISEREAVHLSYVKNVERKSLSPIEKANHIKRMRDVFGYTLEELFVMGYGPSATISNKLKLLDLPEDVQGRIQKGELTEGHGLVLTELKTPKEQQLMAKRIVDFNYTVKITREKVKRLLAKQAKVPEDRTDIIIPSGDVPGVYFKDARNMSELPDECVHLVVTSPPYFVGKEYEKGTTWDEHIENIRSVMLECGRVLVPGGIIAINVCDIHNFKGPKGKNERSQTQLMAHRYQGFLRKHHILLTDTIIWTKRPAWGAEHNHLRDETPHCSYKIMSNWEPIYIFRKKGDRPVPPEDIVLQSKLTREQWMTYVNAVWDIEPNYGLNQGHPCTYPDELVKRLVRSYSYACDTVLDCYLGSGTTVKVARELGRIGIGYERELQYKATIMQKLGMTDIEDTLRNVQETLKADNWAPDLSAEGIPSETGEDQEAEEAVALAAEVGEES